GQVDSGASYYQITGGTANGFYTVTLSNLNTDANLSVHDAGFVNMLCFSAQTGASDSCVAPANGAGELYVRVSGANAGLGTTLTLNATVAANPFYAAEGTAGAPLAISSPHSGEVDTTASYYLFSGLAADSDYRITLGQTNAGVVMWIYDDAFATPQCVRSKSPSKDAVCITTSDGSGNLWVKVDGSTTTFGAAYQLTSAAYIGQASEGTGGAPISIAGTFTGRASTVQAGGNSFYKITGLTPSSSYTVTLSALSGGVDLDVYSTGFPVGFLCGGYQLGLTTESCSAAANASGELYVLAAEGDITGAGSTFDLSVQ
ncbi:MAG: hypothetical protein V3S29_11270, partial [bacterium]